MDASTFVLFDTAHWAAIFSTLGIAAGLPWLAREARGGEWVRPIGIALGVALALHHVVKGVSRVVIYGYPLEDNLQLNLCDLGIYLGLVVMITGHRKLYEVVYFWGLAGTLQALLTPDLERGFPHPVWWMYFVSHGGVIVLICYATFAMGLRPRFDGVWRVFAITNLWALVAGTINYFLGTNYLYLCQKPAGASLADFFPPWPWYILVLEVLAIASFLLYYAPFAVADALRERVGERKGPETEIA